MPDTACLLISDPHTLASAREALEPLGLALLELPSGAELVAACDAEKTQLVLLDGTDPALECDTLCEELRRLPGGEHTPVLVLVDGDDPDTTEREDDGSQT